MNPIYVPLLSALAGALIGSFSSIAAIYIQAKSSERRERIRQALTLAMEDIKNQLANAKPGTGVYPISIYLHHHLAVLRAIEKNKYTPERLREIAAADEGLMELCRKVDDDFRKKMKEAKQDK
ncbi:MAG: hypothetical protein WA728_32590 [Xanthobacteraceae bacterium]